MAIQVECKYCGTQFRAKEEWISKRAKCRYCGRVLLDGEINLDHVKPYSRGGKTIQENLVVSCKKCNIAKGDRTPEEAGMELLPICQD